MQTFTPIEYLKIDIANQFGLDKATWNERIDWTDHNMAQLEQLDQQAEVPVAYRKAVRALRDVQAGKPTNHIMGLDATASGPQIMACLSGCHRTARMVNLVNTGKRENLYQHTLDYMLNKGVQPLYAAIKQAVMTTFYNSTRVPEDLFGKGTEALKVYYEFLKAEMAGAWDVRNTIQSCWNPKAEYYQWRMPDGHIVRIPVTQVKQKSLEIDELDHLRVSYRTEVVAPQAKGRALPANLVHSIDGWICRQMVLMAAKQGFWLAPIHDCFYASPKYMNEVRRNYLTLLCVIADGNWMQDLLSQINGKPVQYNKHSNDLSRLIREADYALS